MTGMRAAPSILRIKFGLCYEGFSSSHDGRFRLHVCPQNWGNEMTITSTCQMCGDVHATSDMEVIEVCNRELLICKSCQDVCEKQANLYCDEPNTSWQ